MPIFELELLDFGVEGAFAGVLGVLGVFGVDGVFGVVPVLGLFVLALLEGLLAVGGLLLAGGLTPADFDFRGELAGGLLGVDLMPP